MTGMPKEASRLAKTLRPACDCIIGPVNTKGFFALSNAVIISLITGLSALIGIGSKSAAFGINVPLSKALSKTSEGRLMWTGPGLPDFAIETAFAKSLGSSDTLLQTQDAFVSGAAISTCAIS